MAGPLSEEIGNEVAPQNEAVQWFRDEINRFFQRYQSFYDRASAELRIYRDRNVRLVSRVYHDLMVIFGDDINAVRQAAEEINTIFEQRVAEAGGLNDCFRNILDQKAENSNRVSSTIRGCALFANTTLSNLLTNTFYPTFNEIQAGVSLVPLLVVDTLSRANVLENEDEIVAYLRMYYDTTDNSW